MVLFDPLFVAKAVSQARVAAGLTQRQLAGLSGLRRETIYRVELGRGSHADTLARIAAALGIPHERLMQTGDYSAKLLDHPRRTPLRDLRLARGLTLRDCAAAAGVSATTVSRLERGNEHYPSICDVKRMGRAWGIHNEDYAAVLGFNSAKELTEYWLAHR